MNKNVVASPCCGSCKCWDMPRRKCKTDSEIVFVDYDDCSCKGKDYSPRNPIPLITVPGVKEMVEKAYREGFRQGLDIDRDNYAEVYEENNTYEYMKAMEAGNE